MIASMAHCGRVTKARFAEVTVDDPEWRQLHRVADRNLTVFARAFRSAVSEAQALVGDALRGAVPSLAEDVALSAWDHGEPALRRACAAAYRRVLEQAGRVSTAYLGRQLGLPVRKQERALVEIAFDVEHPEARAWAERAAADLIRQIGPETRAAIRRIIADAFASGTPPEEVARLIRPLIGLTERQANAVLRYWHRLEDDDETSLDRAYDLAERYAARLHRERALTIARTETMAAANAGQQQAWEQAQERGALTAEDQREWIVTPDDALCERCAALMHHPPVGLREPFVTDVGLLMHPPLHPRCRCVVGLIFAEE